MRRDKYQLLHLIIQGKTSIGRRNSWLKNLRDKYNCNNYKLLRSAVSKKL